MTHIEKAGFIYTSRHYRDGKLIFQCTKRNLMPLEGIHHILGSVVAGQAQILNWYVGIYESAHTPVTGDTMATFPSIAAECVSYSEAQRPLFVPGTIANGMVDNIASPAVFHMTNTTPRTIYGDFITSTATKGSPTGILLSAVENPTPRVLVAGDVWEVEAQLQLISIA